MIRQNPREHEIYRHFKGTLYQIVTVAAHTETGEEMVIYRSLYEPSRVYARPLSMFMSEVDGEKYPNEAQRYRFEKQEEMKDSEEPAEEEDGQEAFGAADSSDCGSAGGNAEAGGRQAERIQAGMAEEDLPEPEVNPLLLEFLDADTYEKKLDLLVGMRNRADDDLLNAIAVSLDLELGKESPEEKYEEVKSCLVMMEKYECNRLR